MNVGAERSPETPAVKTTSRLGLRNGQRPEEDALDDAEDGGRGPVPRARVRTAAMRKVGCLSRLRSPKLRSFIDARRYYRSNRLLD
jgi:hypothetical protein